MVSWESWLFVCRCSYICNYNKLHGSQCTWCFHLRTASSCASVLCAEILILLFASVEFIWKFNVFAEKVRLQTINCEAQFLPMICVILLKPFSLSAKNVEINPKIIAIGQPEKNCLLSTDTDWCVWHLLSYFWMSSKTSLNELSRKSKLKYQQSDRQAYCSPANSIKNRLNCDREMLMVGKCVVNWLH